MDGRAFVNYLQWFTFQALSTDTRSKFHGNGVGETSPRTSAAGQHRGRSRQFSPRVSGYVHGHPCAADRAGYILAESSHGA